MNYGFYGGEKGAPFVLRKNFSSISEMITAFKQGGTYTDVEYEQYVIINTTNRDDSDNGKIYRRGFDYSNDLGGAEYIGQISGAPGPAPTIAMDSIANIKAITPESGSTSSLTEGNLTLSTDDLLPGKDSSGNYNDAIKWCTLSIRAADSSESTAYIGFAFPYPIMEFSAVAVDEYDADNVLTRLDDASHPFYSNWQISVPKGIRGDSIDNFRIMTADSTIESYTGQEDDIAVGRRVLVYDEITYDDSSSGVTKTYYVGPYNTISDVNVSDDGSIVFSDGNSTTTASAKIKWITDADVDIGSTEGTGTQKLSITYNDGTTETVGKPLNYIMTMAIDPSNYTLLAYYSDPARRAALVKAGTAYSYNGKDDWLNLGKVKEYNGIYIGKNYEKSYFTEYSITGIVNVLNTEYPDGLPSTDTDLFGKVITTGDAEESKMVFAYDYAASTWYYIGILGGMEDFLGATSVTAGLSGTVPAPAAGDDQKFLRGDATWADVQNVFVGTDESSTGFSTAPTGSILFVTTET